MLTTCDKLTKELDVLLESSTVGAVVSSPRLKLKVSVPKYIFPDKSVPDTVVDISGI